MPWYAWAFDGVSGVVLVAIVGWGVRRIFSTPASPSVGAVLHSVSDSNGAIGNTVNQQIVHHHASDRPLVLKSTEPSPGQIRADLNALPPFLRHRAPESYQGLSVLWPLTLLSVARHGVTWNVMFSSAVGPYPAPIVDADFTELPREIRVALTNTTIWVRGRIRGVDLLRISLQTDPAIVEVKRP